MPRRDENGYIRYSPEELDQIPSYDARAGGLASYPTGLRLNQGGAERPDGSPILLTPAQVIGAAPRPPAETGAATGALTGTFSGPAPGGGITMGGDQGAALEDFHWKQWAEDHTLS